MTNKLNRREFLSRTVAGVGAAALAGCTEKPASGPPRPLPSRPPAVGRWNAAFHPDPGENGPGFPSSTWGS